MSKLEYDPREIERPFSKNLHLRLIGGKALIDRSIGISIMDREFEQGLSISIICDKGITVLGENTSPRKLPAGSLVGEIGIYQTLMSRNKRAVYIGDSLKLLLRGIDMRYRRANFRISSTELITLEKMAREIDLKQLLEERFTTR